MSANKIQLTKNDESVLFTFTDSKHYLTGNGRIEVPLNSLSLVIDSSDMVTFRKAASNDIFVSAPISDFGMSKAELEDWYAENMVGGTGGGIDPETLAELVSSAEYVSSSSTIDFKNVDGDVISTINAEPFITDGMVDNVQISGTNLVITFNVDAGKQPISIPLTDIFNPSNYYDKTATDALLSGKADTSATTVDEYTIYATRDNNISTAYTSVPITWLKFYPKSNAATTANFQFSGITGYLTLNNIDYANGTYAVAPSSQVQPSAVNGLSITFEDGNMIVEVDGSNPITYASITNTVIEYVKTVIPEKAVSDAVYDNLYPLIKKVDDSLKGVTVNSASTVQQEIGIRQTKNDGGSTNQIVSLGGYLSYSGTTLKAEAYVNTGTDTLTTVAPTINSSSRTDYFFTNNVGQTAESNHIEIQILTGDTINLAFYGYDNTGRLTSRALVVSGGTVTSGYMWPSEATYSLSNGILTVDYAYTGTSANTPLTINRIMATNQYGSTASVSDIVGYVKALLKDKVEVTEYIENTLKPTIDDIEDSEEVIAQSINVLSASLSGKADVSAVTAAVDAVTPCVFDFGRAATLGITDDDWNRVMDAYQNNKPIIAVLGIMRYVCESLVLNTDASDNQVFTFTVSDDTSRYILDVTNLGNSQYQITRYDTIALPTTNDITNWNGKQDTLIAGSGITISGNVISADGGGGGGMSEDDELLLATALVDLNDRKMDASEVRAGFNGINKKLYDKYQPKGDYVTSGQLDTRLADYETALDEQNVEEVASYALNDLNERLTTVETALGGLSLSAITQSQWATISGSANPSTIYIITNNE